MQNIQHNVNLQNLHSFRLAATANEVIYLNDTSQLADLPDHYYVLGEGSNTIFCADYQVPIVKVNLKGLNFSEHDEYWLLNVAAGENWHQLVTESLEHGVYGFENLALIPGTVGAAPVQNIGAYGVEVCQFIDEVSVWDRQTKRSMVMSKAACDFGYRDSIFKRNPERWVILSVTFKMPKAWQPETSYGELQSLANSTDPWQIYHRVIEVRQYKLPDPSTIPNAGSFFKNPVISVGQSEALKQNYSDMPTYPVSATQVKVAAGWLIDNLGWKGKGVGGAAVHDRQALVLINKAHASGADLLELARSIKTSVAEQFNIQLEAEVRLLAQDKLVEL